MLPPPWRPRKKRCKSLKHQDRLGILGGFFFSEKNLSGKMQCPKKNLKDQNLKIDWVF